MLNINEILSTKKARVNFIKGLISIAKADCSLDESEQVFFTNAAYSLELEEDEISAMNDYMCSDEDYVDLEFDSKKQVLFFLREALQLCYIDGRYDDKEKTIIEKIRVRAGINEQEKNNIEAWVKEGIEWSLRGEKLIEVEG